MQYCDVHKVGAARGRLETLMAVMAFLLLGAAAVAQPGLPDISVPSVINTGATIRAIVRDGNKVYVGGLFSSVSGVSRTNLAAFDAVTGVVDPSWNPQPSGEVHSIVVTGGKVYVGGEFTNIAGQSRNRAAALSIADGSSSAQLDVWDPNVNGIVYCMAIAGNRVYLGGAFTSVSGMSRNRLAAYTTAVSFTAGTLDSHWNPNANGDVRALAVDGAVLFAGGAFTSVFGSSRNRLVAFFVAGDSENGVPRPWNPNVNGLVRSLAVAGNRIYAAGAFTTASGGALTRNHLAAFSTDCFMANPVDTAWDPDLDANALALSISGGRLTVGGNFTTVLGGTPRTRMARFNLANGVAAAQVYSDWMPGFNDNVLTLEPSGVGFYIGGLFTTVNGLSRPRLAGFGTVGADLSVVKTAVIPPVVQGQPVEYEIQARNAGPETATSVVVRDVPPTFMAGLVASPASGTTYTNPDWSIPSIAWPPANFEESLSLSAGGVIHAIAQDGCRVYVGGDFTSINGTACTNIAAIDPLTGTVDTTWLPAPDGTVRAIAIGGGRVCIGGAFANITLPGSGTTAAGRAASLTLADGAMVPILDPWNPNLNDTVLALLIEGRRLYIGGSFTLINGGTVRNRLAAVPFVPYPVMSPDFQWNPNMNADVTTLLAANGRIYAGGLFTTVKGSSTFRRLATFNVADSSDAGTPLASWNPNMNGAVYALAIHGGRLYAGGAFTEVNSSTPRTRLAAFPPYVFGVAATVYPGWNPVIDGTIRAIAGDDSCILIGGSFTTLNGGAYPGAGSYNLSVTGGTATPGAWNPGMSAATSVRAITVVNGGAYVGGDFTTSGGAAAVGLASYGTRGPSIKRLGMTGTLSGYGLVTNTAELTADGPTTDPDSTPGNGITTEDDQSSVSHTALTPTPSPSPSASPSASPTPSRTPTPTRSPTPSRTPSASPTPSLSPTPSPTPTPTPLTPGFTNWETAPVSPLGMSPDGTTLAVCNLPNNRLEIFDLTAGVPISIGAVQVGLDPTAVRFRSNTEAWVVNNISDSISVVDITTRRVMATLATKDEPSDVIFAGSPVRAYVSCAQANTIQVFDPATRAQTALIAIAGEQPKALAVSSDGSKVYAAIFNSGNRSTLLGGGLDTDGHTADFPPNAVSDPLGPYAGVNPPPNSGTAFNPPKAAGLPTPPKVGLIVKKNESGQWMDDNAHDWTDLVSGANASASGRAAGWDVLDNDLAIINTANNAVTYATGLMNICMAVGVNPGTGAVYVAGTDATNEIRFEPVLNGRFGRVKLAAIDPSVPSTLASIDLNPHLTYTTSSVAQGERDKSVGDPRGVAWNATGTTGYVTGMGSNNLIVVDAAGDRLTSAPLELGAGPTGVVVDTTRGQLYILNRFDATVSVVNEATLTERTRVAFFDPTTPAIRTGRKHLYDTHKNSGLGQVACGTCHVDAKMDRLAWDLGDPSGTLISTSGRNNIVDFFDNLDSNFHPMKGPMTTQTLQDIIGKEPHHWRGDRKGIEQFSVAFTGLQGDDTTLTTTEMQEFENFLATIYFPPNPYRNFDNTLATSVSLPGHYASGRFSLNEGNPLPAGNAQTGLTSYRTGDLVFALPGEPFYAGFRVDCVSCHTLPTGMGTNRPVAGTPSGFSYMLTFGTPFAPGPNGELNLAMTARDGSTQDAIKIPQLRNLYQKVGMNLGPFTASRVGFGFAHDGAADSLSHFLSEPIFDLASDQEVANVVAFLLSFAGSDLPLGKTTGGSIAAGATDFEPLGELSKDTHAGVGEQVTCTSSSAPSILTQMVAEASESGTGQTRGVDLVAKGVSGGVDRGWVFNRATLRFNPDRAGDAGITQAALLALASPTTPVTFTVVPRGDGARIGIDQDADSFPDRTEIEACSDPANPASVPSAISQITPASGSLDYGTVGVGDGPSAVQSITLGNVGTGSLYFLGAKIVITGPNAVDFIITNSPVTTPLAPGLQRQIDIVFDPTSPGPKIADLTVITDSCPTGIMDYMLTGTGL